MDATTPRAASPPTAVTSKSHHAAVARVAQADYHEPGRAGVWLYDDTDGVRQNIVTANGMHVYRTEAIFKLVNKTTLERAVLQLHHDQPTLLWVYLFSV
eukprot:11737715-Heterocapsa_arctica.AAC.1